MLIYPAIDLKDGKAVRLLHGEFEKVTVYDDDPFTRLDTFEAAGAQWVHVVDLDGARAGSPQQHHLVANLAAAAEASIQTGGGVRERDDVERLLDTGAERVVIGSTAVERPDEVRGWIERFDPARVCLALDVRPRENGGWNVAVRGWKEDSGVSLTEALDFYPPGSVKHVLITDVSRDGALSGPNIELMRVVTRLRPDLQIQASGGVSGLSDLKPLKEAGAAGVIIGRALYEGKFTLAEAIHAG